MTITNDNSAQVVVSPQNHGEVLAPFARVRLSGRNTNGAVEVMELTSSGGPAPHVHQDHDELFFVLEGTFTFTLGHDDQAASEGALVYVPRGTRHGYKTLAGSRVLELTVPAGLEGYFKEMGEGLAAGTNDVEIRRALAGKYDTVPVD